jgi:hypothetical protein
MELQPICLSALWRRHRLGARSPHRPHHLQIGVVLPQSPSLYSIESIYFARNHKMCERTLSEANKAHGILLVK